MLIEFLTLFPAWFDGPLTETILKRAAESGQVEFEVTDIRDFAAGKHRITDDTPYGGGAGMVLKVEPLVGAIEAARARRESVHVALMSPSGRPLDQARAGELALREHLVLVCGRYEGVDDRVREFVDEELSVGDFVLSGGEPAAICVADAVARLVPGVLGDPDSTAEESFADGLLEYPHYTRPRDFRGLTVPDVLLSGDHQAIARWRRMQALQRTRARRPDLLEKAGLTDDDLQLLAELPEMNFEEQE